MKKEGYIDEPPGSSGPDCVLSFPCLGCGDFDLSPSKHRTPETNGESRSKEEACKVLLDYAERYEKIFFGKEGPDRDNQLSRDNE